VAAAFTKRRSPRTALLLARRSTAPGPPRWLRLSGGLPCGEGTTTGKRNDPL